jgi:putative flavoprotein involved in K+ transport
VVLERGETANSWRHERWESLRLLTPNWMTALPGYAYDGDDPDGFMTAAEVVAFLDGYRRSFSAPVVHGVTVESVTRDDDGYEVSTNDGRWQCDVVIAASGSSSEPRVPAIAATMPPHLMQLTALKYQRPAQLPSSGRVLVVGASASGVQIADELRGAGRDVTIAVGEHIRLPRSYRGRDIYWWLDEIGQLDERYDEVEDIARARRHASIQVVGNGEGRDLDLNALRASGVDVIGRLMAVNGTTVQLSGGLANLVKNADLKQARMLRRIDEYAWEHALADVSEPHEARPTVVGDPPTELDVRSFSTVIWATGYRPRYEWLTPHAFDPRGRVRHEGGVGALPGLYFLGLPFMRRRRSNLISGMGADAMDLFDHMHPYLDRQVRGRLALSG